ncbi:unnamed protein product [Cunninghamella blakesleeana]
MTSIFLNQNDDIKDDLKSIGIEKFNTIVEKGNIVVSFFGGVIDNYRSPVKINQGSKDYMMNLTIMEPVNDSKPTQVKLNIFHKDKDSLPIVVQRGDIILCTNMKVSVKFNNLASTVNSKWIVFGQKNDEPQCSKNIHYSIGEKEMIALKIYKNWINKYNLVQKQNNVVHVSKHRRLTKTEDLKTNSFVDYVGKLLSCEKISNMKFPMVSLLLTDYTKAKTPLKYANKMLNDKIDEDYALQCTLYDEHANGCSKLSVGDYVLIENAHCKTHNNGVLELALRGDRNSSKKKVKIHKLDNHDSLVKDIITRENQLKKSLKRKKHDTDIINLKTKLLKNETIRIYAKLIESPERWSFIDNVINSEFDESFFLRVSAIDYKPKNIVDMLVKYCNLCDVSSKIDSNCCRFCQNNQLIPVYRCLLKIKDKNNDILLVAAYESPDSSIFPDIPLVDLRKDAQIQEKLQTRLNLLCGNTVSPGPVLNICIKSSTRYNTKRFTITNTQYIIDKA